MRRIGEMDPFHQLGTVQERMNELFESALARSNFDAGEGVDAWVPVCDIHETDEELVFCLELPGLDQEEIDVRLDGGELVVEGERQTGQEGERYHRVERSFGKFSRRFALPQSIDREDIRATYRNGLLSIRMRHLSARPARAIKVPVD